MKANYQKKQIIPATTFAAALCKAFKCNPEDLAFEIREENKAAAVIYNQQTYVIKTHAALLEEVESMLTTPEEAQLINQSIWTEVTKGVLIKPEFFAEIIEVIDSLEEAGILNLALNLSNRAGNNEEIFWR